MRHVGTMLVLFAGATIAPAADWPQWMGPKRDGVWRDASLPDAFPKDGLKPVWSVPILAGYTGPAVVGDRVYLTDRSLAPGAKLGGAFSKERVEGTERLLCLNAADGQTVWTRDYPCAYTVSYATGPRCTPTADDGRVYFLGTMGDLHACDAATGEILWKKNFVKDYGARVPQWGFACHPLIDGDNLICVGGGDGKLVVAFDKKTGAEKWTALTCPGDFGYCPPAIHDFAGTRQLVVWHGTSINGLDPATGKKLWSVPFECKMSLNVAMPRVVNGDRLFCTSFYNGSILLKVKPDAAEVVWKGKGKSERPSQSADLHAIMATPYVDGNYAYGVCSYGELRCLDVTTGERLWSTNAATRGRKTPPAVAAKETPNEAQPWAERWAHAFLIPHGDKCVLFNEQGELILAKLSPKGYEERGRTTLIEPTNKLPGRPVVWSHPAFAGTKVYVRNDERLVCYDLAK
jgi:outer membrane protein assembly factor BamB